MNLDSIEVTLARTNSSYRRAFLRGFKACLGLFESDKSTKEAMEFANDFVMLYTRCIEKESTNA
jgi:hypothetical protein